CDVFDLIIGTGTGGLIACMFAVLEMSIQEAKDAYVRLFACAFAPETRTREERGNLLKRALEDLLDARPGPEKNFSPCRMSAMNLKDFEKLGRKCKLCINALTAISVANTSSPVLFRAYRGRSISVQCTLLEALLASLADVDSFPELTLVDNGTHQTFISTSFGYCNPGKDLLNEVASLFRSDSVASVVSIGPGRPEPIAVSVGQDGFVRAVIEHARDCQSVSEDIEKRFSRHPNLYTRF
ncbi:hypothetical protein DL96DRAFT_1444813, partial [Flagelloscypha sp. PMI_526]